MDNSQAFSTTYPRGSTRVCRMETCKDHHGKKLDKNLQPFTKTCKRKLNLSRTHTNSPTNMWAQIAGRWITHKHFPQRTPVGVLGSAEWKLVRIIMAKNSVKCALATIHKDLQTQAKPFENAHKFSDKHVDSYAQIAGRWITHKHFPQRTPVGVLGSAEWKLVRIIMAKNSVK